MCTEFLSSQTVAKLIPKPMCNTKWHKKRNQNTIILMIIKLFDISQGVYILKQNLGDVEQPMLSLKSHKPTLGTPFSVDGPISKSFISLAL